MLGIGPQMPHATRHLETMKAREAPVHSPPAAQLAHCASKSLHSATVIGAGEFRGAPVEPPLHVPQLRGHTDTTNAWSAPDEHEPAQPQPHGSAPPALTIMRQTATRHHTPCRHTCRFPCPALHVLVRTHAARHNRSARHSRCHRCGRRNARVDDVQQRRCSARDRTTNATRNEAS